MIKQALNLFFKQQPWAATIRDYAKSVFEEKGIPWKVPVGAEVVEDTLVVVFPDGEQWSITIKSERL